MIIETLGNLSAYALDKGTMFWSVLTNMNLYVFSCEDHYDVRFDPGTAWREPTVSTASTDCNAFYRHERSQLGPESAQSGKII